MNQTRSRRLALLLAFVMIFNFIPFQVAADGGTESVAPEIEVTDAVPAEEAIVEEESPAVPLEEAVEEEPLPVDEPADDVAPAPEEETPTALEETPTALEEAAAPVVPEDEGVPEAVAALPEVQAAPLQAVNPLVKFDLKGTVYWNDFSDASGERPGSIDLVLKQNGTIVNQDPVWTYDNANNVWRFVYTDLDFYDMNGQPYVYTLEGGSAAGYKTTIRQVTQAVYTVEQVWWETPQSTLYFSDFDEPNFILFKKGSDYTIWTKDEVPETDKAVFVQAVNNFHDQGSMKIKANDTVHWYYGDMPDYVDGIRIWYSEATGWQIDIMNPSSIAQFLLGRYSVADGSAVIIQDRYMKLAVTKTWDDDGNRDGKRPAEILITLYADGVATNKTVILNAANNWTYTWTELDQFDAAGESILYTARETVPEGYLVDYLDARDEHYNFTTDIVNSYTPEEREFDVEKVWKDDNNRDGLRPASVMVQLLANGEPLGAPIVLNVEGDWKYTWTGLYVYEDGETIEYAVQEVNVPAGYVSVITKTDTGALVTNTHDVYLRDFSVEKVWDDDSNRDGKRPESILVQLYANGTALGAPVTLNAAGNWSYTWTGLYVNENGTAIQYTVGEPVVPEGYTAVVTYPAEGEYDARITNTYMPQERSFDVEKVWKDDNNRDGLRPASVMVQLLANGEPLGAPVLLNAAGNWKHTWKGLYVYEDGVAIDYTVHEVMVPAGYESEIVKTDTGAVVTNTHDVALRDFDVVKVWEDDDNRDGLRPEAITVQLLANGEVLGEPVVLSADDGWYYEWTGLYVYENGTKIEYTVVELNVPDGYEAEIVYGDEEVSAVITNTHEVYERSFTVSKAWNDDENRDGLRTDAILVQLLANGEPLGEPVVLNAEGDWKYTWTGLYVNENGEAIVYTVQEANVPEGYTSQVLYYEDALFDAIIQNDHEPERIEIGVRKDWDDKDNKFNTRPDKVTVRLLADGKDTGRTAVLTAANKWKHTWTELYKFENGKEIVYTGEEVGVPAGYKVIYDLDDDKSDNILVIVNKLVKEPVPPKTEKPKPPSENPKTGDTGVLLPLLLSGIGLAGIAVLERRRRK